MNKELTLRPVSAIHDEEPDEPELREAAGAGPNEHLLAIKLVTPSGRVVFVQALVPTADIADLSLKDLISRWFMPAVAALQHRAKETV